LTKEHGYTLIPGNERLGKAPGLVFNNDLMKFCPAEQSIVIMAY
jgi:hypothetical protein